ncbi:MAG TPA: HEAT repeat domain-containing protein [Candidatus Dormibacteraeota bacterium]|nr:HEAT repeat domain-containing protein [Candidatus Dormibacteraeota bacterium]
MSTKPPPDLESKRPTRRSGTVRTSPPRSRLAARVDRVLEAALAGEPHAALNATASELLAEPVPVATVIQAAFDRAQPTLTEHLRLTQPFRSTGLDTELVNALASPNPRVRIAAARLCGALRLSDAVPWLGDMMEDSNPKVREAGIRALGRSGGHRAVDVLMTAVDRVPQHRLAIELSRAASDLDIEALMRKPASVQAAIVTVLACGLRRDRLRLGALLGIAHDRRWPATVRVAACKALAMIGDPATEVGLRDLTGEPDASVQEAAIKAHRRFERAGRKSRR